MVSVHPAHLWTRLVLASSALLIACSLEPIAAEVRCRADVHCPGDWHCSVQSGDTGLCTEGRRPTDADGDGSATGPDCDDGDAANFPGNDEVCDGQDNDCDRAPDADEVDADADGSLLCAGDCDDANADILPGNPEVCDGLDNDCDPSTDEEEDADGDGASAICGGDCDDTEAAVFPGNPEVCDGLDNDCDPTTNEQEDGDLDGYASCEGDCDDAEASSFPGNDEVCDGLDNDCSGGLHGSEEDADADGVPPCAGDCDDDDPTLHPGAPELCDDIDSDCDGSLADEFADFDGDGAPDCIDSDADGDGVTVPEDCDDLDPETSPNMSENCDGRDNDCSGALGPDEADADADGVMVCAGDCDDSDPAVFAGNPEVCDGIDNDCDGSIVDEFGDLDADGTPDCIDLDADNDGAPGTADCDDLDPTSTTVATDADCDGAVTAEDCDDTDPTSTLVAYDPDCDGVVDDYVSQGMTLIAIASGTFDMGCTPSQNGCFPDEYPVRAVTLSYDFWLGETEVTREQWFALVPLDPSAYDTCDTCPVENLQWFEAAAFANEVSVAEGLAPCYLLTACSGQVGEGYECSGVAVDSPSGSVIDCQGYRLPTEAEWEYAARAGTDLYEFAGSNTIGDVAWYEGNCIYPQPVFGLQPNDWGLHEMSGNVAEWTADLYSANAYATSGSVDPTGPSGPGTSRVARGGDWNAPVTSGRVAYRAFYSVDDRAMSIGFRLARTAP